MTRDERIVEILGEWLESQESQESAGDDLDALVQRHPDFAEDLRRHFALIAAVADVASFDRFAGESPGQGSLGRYRLLQELGKGGMGTVHLASTPDATPVAVKVVHPHLLESDGFFRRFVREAEIGRRIRHENVVRTLDYDAVSEDGRSRHFLVMEYVEGQTLRELLAELQCVPEKLCRHVAREICKGLGAVHDAGAIHRDLKPENVLITAEHVVKVMDLGVARLVDDSLRLSQTGAFVGSMQYAAPEQFQSGAVEADPRADLFALGVLLYELAVGTHPFDGDDIASVVNRVLHDEPRRIGHIDPALSAFFEEVVHTLLAKDRDERFASAAELLVVLEEGEDSEWWSDRARAIQAQTRRPIRRIRIPRETEVYGRDADLSALRGFFDQAAAGDGRVVLIEGEAGIGKSRVVDELVARLRADGEDFDFLFGSYPPGGAASASGGFSSAYREHFGEAGSEEHLPQTPLLVPAFDAVLRGEPCPKGALELNGASLGTCFVHATRNLAASRTTVVLIDDLHFAPEEARALFTTVALAIPDHRVLLIGTLRPGVPDDWLAGLSRLDHSSRIELSRLGPKDLALLLNDSFKSEQLAQQLAHQIGLKSDGNPFFAFEIIRGLREGQFITRQDDGTWTSTKAIEQIHIPSSVLDLVNARVSALTENERALLDVAACWGYEFDPALVADVIGLARIPAYKALAQVERAHRLVRSSGRRFVFDHHQVQEALYASLPEILREEYHAALATTLEAQSQALDTDPESLDGELCVELCEHFLKGARGQSALRYLESAQRHLEASYLHARVVALTDMAMGQPDLLSGPSRVAALLRASRALDALGARTRQREAAEDAVNYATVGDSPSQLAEAYSALGFARSRTADFDGAAGAFRRALAIARQSEDSAAEGAALGNIGNALRGSGDPAASLPHLYSYLATTREQNNRRNEAAALGNIGAAYSDLGRVDDAIERIEEQLRIAREVNDETQELVAEFNLGLIAWASDRPSDALRHGARALQLSRELGVRAKEAAALGSLGTVYYGLGDLVRARGHIDRWLAISRDVDNRAEEARAIMGQASILFCEGRHADARVEFEEALTIARSIQNSQIEALAYCNLGELSRDLGDLNECVRLLKLGLALSEKLDYRQLTATASLALGVALDELGEGGRDAIERALDVAREVGLPAVETLALCALARRHGRAPDDAVAAVSMYRSRLPVEQFLEAHLHLWRITRDRKYLGMAKRRLDELIAPVDDDIRASMLNNLRTNREIMAAWREQFGDASSSTGSEADTVAGD